MQHILVYSAVKVDVRGAEWVENGVGFHHSDQHGFGLMDAYRLTTVARAWPLIPAMQTWEIAGIGRSKQIPTNSSLLITLLGMTFTIYHIRQPFYHIRHFLCFLVQIFTLEMRPPLLIRTL